MKPTSLDRMVFFGFIISGVLAVIVILALVSVSIQQLAGGKDAGLKTLESLAGVVVGFYFGNFVSLIKDYMRMQHEKTLADHGIDITALRAREKKDQEPDTDANQTDANQNA